MKIENYNLRLFEKWDSSLDFLPNRRKIKTE